MTEGNASTSTEVIETQVIENVKVKHSSRILDTEIIANNNASSNICVKAEESSFVGINGNTDSNTRENFDDNGVSNLVSKSENSFSELNSAPTTTVKDYMEISREVSASSESISSCSAPVTKETHIDSPRKKRKIDQYPSLLAVTESTSSLSCSDQGTLPVSVPKDCPLVSHSMSNTVRAVSKLDSSLMDHIRAPHSHDVLCGRGGGTNNHIGNENFRDLVNEKKRQYLNSSKREKPLVSKSIVEAIRRLSPPGRFLTKNDKTGFWYDIGDQKAREKTSQALREGAPVIRKEMVQGVTRSNGTPPATVLSLISKRKSTKSKFEVRGVPSYGQVQQHIQPQINHGVSISSSPQHNHQASHPPLNGYNRQMNNMQGHNIPNHLRNIPNLLRSRSHSNAGPPQQIRDMHCAHPMQASNHYLSASGAVPVSFDMSRNDLIPRRQPPPYVITSQLAQNRNRGYQPQQLPYTSTQLPLPSQVEKRLLFDDMLTKTMATEGMLTQELVEKEHEMSLCQDAALLGLDWEFVKKKLTDGSLKELLMKSGMFSSNAVNSGIASSIGRLNNAHGGALPMHT